TGQSATSSADQFTYTTGSAPTVTSVSPNSGGAGGNTYVTITGTHLLGATGVNFGSDPADFFIADSDTQITAVSPAGAPGVVDITVTTYSGTSSTSSADQFTYPSAPSISALSSSSGSSAGRYSITITGSNFTDATEVDFGTMPATFVVNSNTSITALVPPEP